MTSFWVLFLLVMAIGLAAFGSLIAGMIMRRDYPNLDGEK